MASTITEPSPMRNRIPGVIALPSLESSSWFLESVVSSFLESSSVPSEFSVSELEELLSLTVVEESIDSQVAL